MQYEWIIGHYKGKQAQNVLASANEGIGYFVRGTGGKGEQLEVEAAFRRGYDPDPLPDHLQRADAYTSDKLDELYKKRKGGYMREAPPTAASKAVSDVFNARKDLD